MSELEPFGLESSPTNNKWKLKELAVVLLLIVISIATVFSIVNDSTSFSLKKRATQIYEQLENGASYHYLLKTTSQQTETIYDVQKDSNQNYYMQRSNDSSDSLLGVYIVNQQVYIISNDKVMETISLDIDANTIDSELSYGPMFVYLQDALETLYSNEKISKDNDKYTHTVDIFEDSESESKVGSEITNIYKNTDLIEYIYQPIDDNDISVYELIEIKEIEQIKIPNQGAK